MFEQEIYFKKLYIKCHQVNINSIIIIFFFSLNLFIIAPYVKVYLLDGKTCVEKQRTRTTRRTLDPLIQQTIMFKENYRDKVLQVNFVFQTIES